jgi:hypothetical protein
MQPALAPDRDAGLVHAQGLRPAKGARGATLRGTPHAGEIHRPSLRVDFSVAPGRRRARSGERTGGGAPTRPTAAPENPPSTRRYGVATGTLGVARGTAARWKHCAVGICRGSPAVRMLQHSGAG